MVDCAVHYEERLDNVESLWKKDTYHWVSKLRDSEITKEWFSVQYRGLLHSLSSNTISSASWILWRQAPESETPLLRKWSFFRLFAWWTLVVDFILVSMDSRYPERARTRGGGGFLFNISKASGVSCGIDCINPRKYGQMTWAHVIKRFSFLVPQILVAVKRVG